MNTDSHLLQHSERFKRDRVHPVMETESMTEQHHRESVEIHHIFRKYKAQGVDLFNTEIIQSGAVDFVDFPDFQEAQNMIARGEEIFAAVPAAIRDDFDNDPGKFIEFMQDAENIQAIHDYGFDHSYLGELPDQVPANAPPAEPSPAPEPAPAATGVE